MEDKIKSLIEEVEAFKASSKEEVEAFRIKFLSKKGIIPALFGEMKDIAAEKRKEFGLIVNELKNKAEEKLHSLQESLEASSPETKTNLDLTLPAEPYVLGARHPISIIRSRILEIFSHIGFTVAYGPEIEDDWHNFTALNFPENHPARDMQDTFFVKTGESHKDEIALRTHTSSVQVRVMESQKPPIRVLAPGRV